MTKYIDGARSVLELPNFRWPLERYHAAITAGIMEYWIVNVFEQQIERFTEPHTKEGSYGKEGVFKRGDIFPASTSGGDRG